METREEVVVVETATSPPQAIQIRTAIFTTLPPFALCFFLSRERRDNKLRAHTFAIEVSRHGAGCPATPNGGERAVCWSKRRLGGHARQGKTLFEGRVGTQHQPGTPRSTRGCREQATSFFYLGACDIAREIDKVRRLERHRSAAWSGVLRSREARWSKFVEKRKAGGEKPTL